MSFIGQVSLIGSRLSLAMLAPLFLAAAPAGTMQTTSTFYATILNVQNQERMAMGLAPMQWNDQLAAAARQWAQYLADTGQFRHAPQDPANRQGENIWAGTRGAFSPRAMVDAWIEEKQYFHSGRFPNISTTSDWKTVGHYTQIMWRDTREVGCARVNNEELDILVCRYSQPGNIFGQKPF